MNMGSINFKCFARLVLISCVTFGAATIADSQSITSDNFRPKPRAIAPKGKTRPRVKEKRGAKYDSARLTDLQNEPSTIQKMHHLIVWFAPIVNKLPRGYKDTLGERIENGMYDILEDLVAAKTEKERSKRLETADAKLDVLRHQ